MKNKVIETICLNGPNKGMHQVEVNYTKEQAQAIKDKMKMKVNGVNYAGYCRRCGQPVRQKDVMYIENTNGYGTLSVDVFHRWCL